MKIEIAPGYETYDWETIIHRASSHDDDIRYSAIRYSRIHLAVTLLNNGYSDDELRRNLPRVVERCGDERSISKELVGQVTRFLRLRNRGDHRGLSPHPEHVMNDVRAVRIFCQAVAAEPVQMIAHPQPPTQLPPARSVATEAGHTPSGWEIGLSVVASYFSAVAKAEAKERAVLGDAEYERRKQEVERKEEEKRQSAERARKEAEEAKRIAAEREHARRLRSETWQAVVVIILLFSIVGVYFYVEHKNKKHAAERQSRGRHSADVSNTSVIDGGIADAHVSDFVQRDTKQRANSISSGSGRPQLDASGPFYRILAIAQKHSTDEELAETEGRGGPNFERLCALVTSKRDALSSVERKRLDEDCGDVMNDE